MGLSSEFMASSIHTTTLAATALEMDTNGWSLDQTLASMGFPMYFAFDDQGGLAIIGGDFHSIPTENHQQILLDIRRQLISKGFNLHAFVSQNCIYAVESNGQHHSSITREQASKSGKQMLMTQVCTVSGEDIALCTTFNNDEGGYCTNNDSVKESEQHHILWGAATDCSVTFQDM